MTWLRHRVPGHAKPRVVVQEVGGARASGVRIFVHVLAVCSPGDVLCSFVELLASPAA